MTFNQKYDLQKTINEMKDLLCYLDCEDSLEDIIDYKKKVDKEFNKLISMYKQFKSMENLEEE